MSGLHNALRSEHHLKHFGRLQYGLFLKSIGLTLEQALAFWRSEFIKKMEPDKVEWQSLKCGLCSLASLLLLFLQFEKQYAYNVRHGYGKEGKRANYTAYSCMKIILSNPPGHGDWHGEWEARSQAACKASFLGAQAVRSATGTGSTWAGCWWAMASHREAVQRS